MGKKNSERPRGARQHGPITPRCAGLRARPAPATHGLREAAACSGVSCSETALGLVFPRPAVHVAIELKPEISPREKARSQPAASRNPAIDRGSCPAAALGPRNAAIYHGQAGLAASQGRFARVSLPLFQGPVPGARQVAEVEVYTSKGKERAGLPPAAQR